MKRVRIRIPASTSNLGPGFDGLGLALGLYVEITIEEVGAANPERHVARADGPSDEVRITANGEGADQIDCGRSNVVYQAMLACFGKAGRDPRSEGKSFRINISNQIPVARGLGSSGAGRIGGLIGANVLGDLKLSEKEIINLATELEGHPDNVVPSMVGGFIASFQADGSTEYVRIDPPAGVKAVVLVPDFGVSTDEARRVLPQRIPFSDAIYNIGRAAFVSAAFAKGELDALGSAMRDRIHQQYREELIPGMNEVFDAAIRSGALGAALSGAGSAIIAFARDDAALIGNEMQTEWKRAGVESKSLILDLDNVGTVIEES